MIINESISIAREPELIWKYWMDVSNDVYWRNGIIKAVWTSHPPYGIGSTGEHTDNNMGILYWEVTRFEDGKSFEFTHTAGGLKGSVGFFQVEPENDGSLIKVKMRISGSFIMRLMLLFMESMIRKNVRGDIEKLRELLEKQDTDA